MSFLDASNDLNVSLEPHLAEKLNPLPPLLPSALADRLSVSLGKSSVPYSFLRSVSQWSRNPSGSAALRSHNPPLDPRDYDMVSLLVGCTTAPEGKFGHYVPEKEPEELATQKNRDRKAITTLLNALLSIGGAGFAAYWAAERTGWRNEWRVLFALLVAVVVAASEAVLFLIWQSRQGPTGRKVIRRSKAMDKKAEDSPHEQGGEGVNVTSREDAPILRQRTAVNART